MPIRHRHPSSPAPDGGRGPRSVVEGGRLEDGDPFDEGPDHGRVEDRARRAIEQDILDGGTQMLAYVMRQERMHSGATQKEKDEEEHEAQD